MMQCLMLKSKFRYYYFHNLISNVLKNLYKPGCIEKMMGRAAFGKFSWHDKPLLIPLIIPLINIMMCYIYFFLKNVLFSHIYIYKKTYNSNPWGLVLFYTYHETDYLLPILFVSIVRIIMLLLNCSQALSLGNQATTIYFIIYYHICISSILYFTLDKIPPAAMLYNSHK